MQVVEEPAKGPVGEDESARAPVAEMAGPEEEAEVMVSFLLSWAQGGERECVCVESY